MTLTKAHIALKISENCYWHVRSAVLTSLRSMEILEKVLLSATISFQLPR
jgi:hypothetical protein